jgi:hypothetical protein
MCQLQCRIWIQSYSNRMHGQLAYSLAYRRNVGHSIGRWRQWICQQQYHCIPPLMCISIHLTSERPTYVHANTHKKRPPEIHFIYLGNNEIYHIFKTSCVISTLFPTKCCICHNFIFSCTKI